MWSAMLVRFWKPLAGAVLLIGLALWAHHAGYESGHAASEAHWRPLFAQAERARDAANLAARQKEESSIRLTQNAEAEHEKVVASLNLRAADADQRIRAIGLRLAAASARRCEVSAIPGATAVPDAASTGVARADGAGASISDTGRRCELDAATLAGLQRWIIGQRAIFQRSAAP
jgi:hypothetical protein